MSRSGKIHYIKGRPTRTRKSWESMLSRCYNVNSTGYKNYGGRGIIVCDRWHSFDNFLSDMGIRPEGKSLDRYPNNDGNYEKTNCRWATPKEQSYSKLRLITFNGKTMGVKEWAAELGIKHSTLSMRLNKHGWSVNRAFLTIPSRGKKRFITFNGKTMCVNEWAADIGITPSVLSTRLSRSSWSIERALSTKG